jgi:hypothetical protein
MGIIFPIQPREQFSGASPRFDTTHPLPELPNAHLIQDVLRIVGIDVDEFSALWRFQ